MKYKYNALIENHDYVRTWLERINYVRYESNENDINHNMLFAWTDTTTNTPHYVTFNENDKGMYIKGDYIDCTCNIKLFKAVTAINDDSDYLQWFVNKKIDLWVLVYNKVNIQQFMWNENYDMNDYDGMEKANIEQLKKKFKPIIKKLR